MAEDVSLVSLSLCSEYGVLRRSWDAWDAYPGITHIARAFRDHTGSGVPTRPNVPDHDTTSRKETVTMTTEQEMRHTQGLEAVVNGPTRDETSAVLSAQGAGVDDVNAALAGQPASKAARRAAAELMRLVRVSVVTTQGDAPALPQQGLSKASRRRSRREVHVIGADVTKLPLAPGVERFDLGQAVGMNEQGEAVPFGHETGGEGAAPDESEGDDSQGGT